jgi:hypothetical protein
MRKKIVLSDQELNKIYKLRDLGISLREISRRTKYSFFYIQSPFNNKKSNFIEDKEGFIIVAVCKKTNTKIYDYKNTSGAITKHMLKTLFTETYNDNLSEWDIMKMNGYGIVVN